MISCTEFIPLYSEFFKYLEEKGGHDAVLEYWYYISDNSIGDITNPNSLASKCELYGGFDGARAYWGHTLTEEACDLLEVSDNKNRFKYSHMRHCPSRGMLNDLKHVEPYYDYCEHCNVIYARVLEKYGVEYLRDDSAKANAECRSILFEKGCCPNFDWRNISDEDAKKLKKDDSVKIVDMKTEDNKYLHRDFHLSGDLALKYCGEKFGDNEVIGFITSYVKNYYSPIITEIKEKGLIYLKEWIENIYETEEARDVLHTELKENELTVTIDKSPVIEYMRSLNQEPSKYYIEETRTLYDVIARESGLKFNLVYYNDDGATKFVFSK